VRLVDTISLLLFLDVMSRALPIGPRKPKFLQWKFDVKMGVPLFGFGCMENPYIH
jgi:hypothetical protein